MRIKQLVHKTGFDDDRASKLFYECIQPTEDDLKIICIELKLSSEEKKRLFSSANVTESK